MDTLIRDAMEFAQEVFAQDRSGHDYFHTLRVCRMAERLGAEEGADLLTVRLAALLHDVDDVKLSPGTHENMGRAVAFLRKHGVPEERIKAVCEIIGEVSFRGTDSVIPRTIEGKCVQDADRLDAIGAVGIARAFAYGGSHDRVLHDPAAEPVLNMTGEEYRAHCSTTVNHFYEKLFLLKDLLNTASAKRIGQQRDAYMRAYLAEFLEEWDGKR